MLFSNSTTKLTTITTTKVLVYQNRIIFKIAKLNKIYSQLVIVQFLLQMFVLPPQIFNFLVDVLHCYLSLKEVLSFICVPHYSFQHVWLAQVNDSFL